MTDEEAMAWGVPTDKEHEEFMRIQRAKMILVTASLVILIGLLIMLT